MKTRLVAGLFPSCHVAGGRLRHYTVTGQKPDDGKTGQEIAGCGLWEKRLESSKGSVFLVQRPELLR
jgi:hypothetical protein